LPGCGAACWSTGDFVRSAASKRGAIADGIISFVTAAYLKLAGSGELAERASLAWIRLEDCDLCARYCRVDRHRTIKDTGLPHHQLRRRADHCRRITRRSR
jgi:uncharacterized Fe-S radical SAM superfamily protein PflX